MQQKFLQSFVKIGTNQSQDNKSVIKISTNQSQDNKELRQDLIHSSVKTNHPKNKDGLKTNSQDNQIQANINSNKTQQYNNMTSQNLSAIQNESTISKIPELLVNKLKQQTFKPQVVVDDLVPPESGNITTIIEPQVAVDDLVPPMFSQTFKTQKKINNLPEPKPGNVKLSTLDSFVINEEYEVNQQNLIKVNSVCKNKQGIDINPFLTAHFTELFTSLRELYQDKTKSKKYLKTNMTSIIIKIIQKLKTTNNNFASELQDFLEKYNINSDITNNPNNNILSIPTILIIRQFLIEYSIRKNYISNKTTLKIENKELSIFSNNVNQDTYQTFISFALSKTTEYDKRMIRKKEQNGDLLPTIHTALYYYYSKNGTQKGKLIAWNNGIVYQSKDLEIPASGNFNSFVKVGQKILKESKETKINPDEMLISLSNPNVDNLTNQENGKYLLQYKDYLDMVSSTKENELNIIFPDIYKNGDGKFITIQKCLEGKTLSEDLKNKEFCEQIKYIQKFLFLLTKLSKLGYHQADPNPGNFIIHNNKLYAIDTTEITAFQKIHNQDSIARTGISEFLIDSRLIAKYGYIIQILLFLPQTQDVQILLLHIVNEFFNIKQCKDKIQKFDLTGLKDDINTKIIEDIFLDKISRAIYFITNELISKGNNIQLKNL